jgi:hypothetical protein
MIGVEPADGPIYQVWRKRAIFSHVGIVDRMDYQTRVTAFVDILGWTQAVLESENNAVLRARMENAVTAIHSLVANDASDLAEWERPVPDDQVSLFSDSLIISYPYTDPNDLTRMIRRVAEYQTIMLLEGFPLRGGITIGLLYHSGTVAFGPALNRAVELEHVHAKVPRVIVEKFLSEQVKKAAKRFPHHWSFVKEDDDGFLFPDYLTPIALSDAMTAQVTGFVRGCLDRYKGDDRVFPKYQWLSGKVEDAAADAPLRRDIHHANHQRMQSALREGANPDEGATISAVSRAQSRLAQWIKGLVTRGK